MKLSKAGIITRRESMKYIASSLVVAQPVFGGRVLPDVSFLVSGDEKRKEGLFAYRSFWPEFEAMKRFGDNGVNTYCIFPANTYNSLGEPYSKYPPVWRWFSQYDFDSLNKQFDDVIALNPQAEFIAMIDLNSPIWLEKYFSHRYPGEGDSYEALSSTCANPQWKKETAKYLDEIVSHLENRYGARIKSYLLSCGATSEWLDLGQATSSRMKSERWKSWLKAKGKTAKEIPSISRIYNASFEGLIRDPENEQDIIDYAQFSGDMIVDTVLEFAEIVRKSASVKTQIGVFFGYILELAKNRLIWAGHLEYERLFASPSIDFFISPGTYTDRLMGGGSGFMVPNGTRVLNGKGFLHEIDHRTHTYNYNISDFITYSPIAAWKDQRESTAGLKREFSLAIVNRSSLWCFDMFGGVFSTDDTMKVVRQSKELWDKYSDIPTRGVAEIALIADPQSARFINDRNDAVEEIYVKMRNKLNRIGAPFEVFSFDDLDKIPPGQYKVIIFPGTFFISEERLSFLKKHVFNHQRTVVFLYAPGISNGNNLDVARIKDITGTAFRTPGVSKVDYDGWRSVYIHDYKTVTPAVLRQVAKESGVNIYIDQEAPVYANDRLLALHVAEGGQKEITFPKEIRRVKELYTGKELLPRGRSFVYAFSTPDTVLFEYQV